jgi:DNA-directed RNA polymerase specialized sigma54-like protein
MKLLLDGGERLSKKNPKNVTKKRHDFTKPEREYLRGIVHNLSFQRLTDREIVQWLHDEKQIDLDRRTVSKFFYPLVSF